MQIPPKIKKIIRVGAIPAWVLSLAKPLAWIWGRVGDFFNAMDTIKLLKDDASPAAIWAFINQYGWLLGVLWLTILILWPARKPTTDTAISEKNDEMHLPIAAVLTYEDFNIHEVSGSIQVIVKNSSSYPVNVWSPTWENSTGDVNCSPVAPTQIIRMDRDELKPTWEQCTLLEVNHRLACTVPLLTPNGEDGIRVRLRERRTGTLLFAIKTNGVLKVQKIKI